MLPPEFTKQVTEAYEHLYDIVFLRTHPLTDTLVPDPAVDRKDKAWQLHRLLIDAVEELKPNPNAPASSHERRRYQLVARRYVDGLDPQRVADELGISRRHYYRAHSETMEAIAELLWERRSAAATAAPMPAPEAHADRLELLRLEVAPALEQRRGLHRRVMPLHTLVFVYCPWPDQHPGWHVFCIFILFT